MAEIFSEDWTDPTITVIAVACPLLVIGVLFACLTVISKFESKHGVAKEIKPKLLPIVPSADEFNEVKKSRERDNGVQNRTRANLVDQYEAYYPTSVQILDRGRTDSLNEMAQYTQRNIQSEILPVVVLRMKYVTCGCCVRESEFNGILTRNANTELRIIANNHSAPAQGPSAVPYCPCLCVLDTMYYIDFANQSFGNTANELPRIHDYPIPLEVVARSAASDLIGFRIQDANHEATIDNALTGRALLSFANMTRAHGGAEGVMYSRVANAYPYGIPLHTSSGDGRVLSGSADHDAFFDTPSRIQGQVAHMFSAVVVRVTDMETWQPNEDQKREECFVCGCEGCIQFLCHLLSFQWVNHYCSGNKADCIYCFDTARLYPEKFFVGKSSSEISMSGSPLFALGGTIINSMVDGILKGQIVYEANARILFVKSNEVVTFILNL